MRGGGRPANDKLAAEAYAVWSYMREREAEGLHLKEAVFRAREHFGLGRATLFKRLWLVNEVGVILAHLHRNAPELYEEMVATLHSAGWFRDD